MSTPVLELRDVRKSYPGGVQALRGVSLAIARGELAAIVGPSGSGKSTLLHMMGTLDRPTSGAVAVEGREVSTAGDDELAGVRARRLAGVAASLRPTLGLHLGQCQKRPEEPRS